MTMSQHPPSTVAIKVKYLWLIFVIFLVLLATAPALYYINGLYAPASSTPTAPTGGGGGGGGGGSTNGATVNCQNPCTIVIQNSIFGTGQYANHPVVVKVGTKVTWSNQDGTQHTTTSDTALWGSPILNPGKSFSFTFTSAGTYTYHCEIHPMTGTVIVVS
jgi:hypothetical protein